MSEKDLENNLGSSELEDSMIQRLAFIKYLYTLGVNQSNQPEPFCGVSILSFHDCVELFFDLSLDKLQSSKTDREFLKYFNVINNKIKPKQLSQERGIQRLNKTRVDLKHHGIIPSKVAIDSSRYSTESFLKDNCPLIFNIEFEKISLIDIIKYQKSKQYLKKATELYYNKNIKESLHYISWSFETLIKEYEKTKEDYFGSSPFLPGERLSSFGYDLCPNEVIESVNYQPLKGLAFTAELVKGLLAPPTLRNR